MNAPMDKTILVVDDRKNILKVIKAILNDEGYHVLTAGNGDDAFQLYGRNGKIDVVLSDLKLPKMSGLELYRQIKSMGNAPPFVIMTAYGTVKNAVKALKEGVANYLIKPLDYDELVLVLNKIISDRALTRELETLKSQCLYEGSFHGIIGVDFKMKAIYDMVRTVGATDASVLIYGETGTGKELLAKALHAESPRRGHAMVCINSAALSESLLEAELFGYIKGAFTGAMTDRKGRLEMAHQGTLFLDEIGHMSLGLQAKLLRFLQEMAFEPVGGVNPRSVDVRIIAATNLDLKEEIRAGRFLKDLLYRIEVVPIKVPTLRERRDDICILVDHFIKIFSRQYEKSVKGISPDAIKILMAYHWPGNVRELKNCIARAVILSKSEMVMPEDLSQNIISTVNPSSIEEGKNWIQALPKNGISLRQMEMELIEKTLILYGGNKSLSAQSLGISRKTLYEKIGKYDLTR